MIVRPVLHLALLTCLGLSAQAADAPTQEQWQPVLTAIQSGSPTARSELQRITAAFPGWIDGWVEAARFELGQGDAKQAWAHARKALGIERTNADAAAIAIQALVREGRAKDVATIAAPIVGKPQVDKLADGRGGWVAYQAALAALALDDTEAAAGYLRQAKISAGATIPGEFHLIDALLAKQKGDLAQAEATLERAVAAEPRIFDAWYELGRVRSLLAQEERTDAGKRARYQAAITAFATCTTALSKDKESWYGQAVANLHLARLDLIAGGDGGAALRQATAAAEKAVQVDDRFASAWAVLGECHLRQERWDQAVTALERARALAHDTPAVRSNLAAALQKTGRGQEALALIAAGGDQLSAAELLAQGLSAYAAGNHVMATASLAAAAGHDDVTGQDDVRAHILRYLGHAELAWAAADPDPIASEQHREAAATAYRQAGDLGDHLARRAYAAHQATREPIHGYRAGWATIGWYGFGSITGWKQVIGNYGAARAWENPLHLAVWGVLVVVPFLLWIKSLLGRGSVPVEQARPPRPERPAPAATASNREPAPRRGAPAAGATTTAKPQAAPRPKGEVSALTRRQQRATTDGGNDEPAPKPATRRQRPPLPETEEIRRDDGT